MSGSQLGLGLVSATFSPKIQKLTIGVCLIEFLINGRKI